MEKKVFENLEAVLNLSKILTLENLDALIDKYLERKADRMLALQEVDRLLALLQSHILLVSVYFKQHYIINRSLKNLQPHNGDFLTKQEIAARYKVSVRTINNWVLDGLVCVEIGGVKRISVDSINEFVKKGQSKKFNWKSVAK